MSTPALAGPIPNPLAVPLPPRFRHHLDAANQHFQPVDEFTRLLTLHQARALWGLGRTDENLTVSTNLVMEAEWDLVDQEYEEADAHCHAVLAAATLAERRSSRRRISEANRHLNRFQLTATLLKVTSTKA